MILILHVRWFFNSGLFHDILIHIALMRFGCFMILNPSKVVLVVVEFYHSSGVVNLGLHRWSSFQHRVDFTRLIFLVYFNWGLWRIDIYYNFILLFLKEVILIVLDPTNGGLRAKVNLAFLFGLWNVGKWRLTNLISWVILFLMITLHVLVISGLLLFIHVLLNDFVDLLIGTMLVWGIKSFYTARGYATFDWSSNFWGNWSLVYCSIDIRKGCQIQFTYITHSVMGCRYIILQVTNLLSMMIHHVLVCSTLLLLNHLHSGILHSVVFHYLVILVLLLLFDSHESFVALELLFPHLRILVMSCLCDSDILHIMIRILHMLVLLELKHLPLLTLITNLPQLIVVLFEYLINFVMWCIQVRQ